LSVVRVRQHVNPLSQKYQQPTQPPNWDKVYADPTAPLHLDIGCGRGAFLLEMAQRHPDWNFLGLEIREPLVIQANIGRQETGLTNLHFLFCNANASLALLLASLPPGTLQRVTLQFPDPWFKKRHQKRRVLQPEVVEVLATYLISGGVRDHPAFIQQGSEPWLPENPLNVATEREKMTLERGDPVYRAVFVRR
jgi:tRNA (guanine-N7-)-methyltransferase